MALSMDDRFNSGTKSPEFSPPSVRREGPSHQNQTNFLLAFAAVCTAGILLPLDWTIGIRLAKEDELQGLDSTGNVSLLEIDQYKRIEYSSSW